MKKPLMISGAIMLMATAASVSAADGPTRGASEWPLGLRAGLTVDPDQIHLGGHVDAGRLHPQVLFRPSAELGFGDDRIVGAINLDALYHLPQGSAPTRPYVGGGPGIAVIDYDDGPGGRDDSDVEAGLNVVGGLEFGPRQRYLVEVRGGIGDLPDLKLTAGMRF